MVNSLLNERQGPFFIFFCPNYSICTYASNDLALTSVLRTEHCDRFLQAIIYRLLDGLWVTEN